MIKDDTDKGSERDRAVAQVFMDEALLCIAGIFKAVPKQLQAEIDASKLDIKDLLGM